MGRRMLLGRAHRVGGDGVQTNYGLQSEVKGESAVSSVFAHPSDPSNNHPFPTLTL